VAIVAAAIAFTAGVKFRDFVPGKSAPSVISAPEPARDRPSKSPPRQDRDAEEIQQLIRKDPL